MEEKDVLSLALGAPLVWISHNFTLNMESNLWSLHYPDTAFCGSTLNMWNQLWILWTSVDVYLVWASTSEQFSHTIEDTEILWLIQQVKHLRKLCHSVYKLKALNKSNTVYKVYNICTKIKMGVSKNIGTQNGWFTMENPILIGWFGGTIIFGNTQIYIYTYIYCIIHHYTVLWGSQTLSSEKKQRTLVLAKDEALEKR